MTHQERYDAEKTTAQQLAQSYRQTQEQMSQLQQEIIRVDARMALLETLLNEEQTAEAPKPLALVIPEAEVG